MSNLLEQLSNEIRTSVDRARATVVCVGTGKATPRTGVVIAPNEIVTVAMVAEEGERVPVHGPDGAVEAEVVGFDEGSGLALLRAEGFGEAVEIETDAPRVGDLGVTIAYPIENGHEARLAMIRCVGGPTRLRGGRRVGSYLQTDAPRFTGFAAAVHFSAAGRAVGISMPTHRREEAYLLPMSEVVRIVEQLRHGTVGTGYLGVQTTAVALPAAVGDSTEGLLITRVERDSPAERAGLTVGHFIVSVGGNATARPEELYDSLTGLTKGSTLAVVVALADGTTRSIDVEVSLRK